MRKRLGASILLVVLVAWSIAPVARAYQLVAGRSAFPDEYRAPVLALLGSALR